MRKASLRRNSGRCLILIGALFSSFGTVSSPIMDKFPENTGKQKKHRKEYITKRKLEFTLLPPVETRYSEEEIRQALMENYGSLNNTALEL